MTKPPRSTETHANGIRIAILVALLVAVYSGPAFVFTLNHIFDSKMFQDGSTAANVMAVLIIWVFAIPLILAFAKWESDPAGSAIALGIFLIIMLILVIIIRQAIAGLLALAIQAPFLALNIPEPKEAIVVPFAFALTIFLWYVTPAAAFAVQVAHVRRM